MSSSSQKRKATGPDSYTDNVWKRTKGTVAEKLERSRPFRFFLSAVDSDPSTHTEDSTLSFPGMMSFDYRRLCNGYTMFTVIVLLLYLFY